MRFIESICFDKGEYKNLQIHQGRMDQTCFHFFGESPHRLNDLLPEIQSEAKHKIRLIYDGEMCSCTFEPYVKRPIASLQIVESEWFDYSFKYEDRNVINKLLENAQSDEIIISREGLITDCSYANLIFWNGNEWLTPEAPLLAGTKRAFLLGDKTIKKAVIKRSELKNFKSVSLINSMLDPGDIQIDINSVLTS